TRPDGPAGPVLVQRVLRGRHRDVRYTHRADARISLAPEVRHAVHGIGRRRERIRVCVEQHDRAPDAARSEDGSGHRVSDADGLRYEEDRVRSVFPPPDALHRQHAERETRPGGAFRISGYAMRAEDGTMRKSIRDSRRLLTVTLMLLASVAASAQRGATQGEWRTYAGNLGSTKYSPLDQINKANVS